MTVKDPRADIPAERSVLGACFTTPIALGLARAILRSEDFALPEHGDVFAMLCEMSDGGEAIDLVTLSNALRLAGSLDRIAKAFDLDELDFIGSGSERVEAYAQIVADHSEARRCRDLATKLYRMANDPRVATHTLHDLSRSIAKGPRVERGKMLDEHMEELQRELEATYSGRPLVVAHTTGIQQLDQTIGGLRGGQLIALAGQTGHGKSALAMTMALTLAALRKPPCLFISLEMPGNDLAVRAASFITEITQTRIRAAQIDKLPADAPLRAEEIAAVEVARNAIKGRVRTLCPGDMTVAEIRDIAIGMKAGDGLSAIFVDYLQLMGATQDHRSREREVADVSRGLKSLAMELDVPVVALSQLSRKAENYDEPVPSLLRESGQIENDASAVVFIWATDPPSDDRVRLFVSKSRFSPPCNFEVKFHRALSRFADLADNSVDTYRVGGFDAE